MLQTLLTPAKSKCSLLIVSYFCSMDPFFNTQTSSFFTQESNHFSSFNLSDSFPEPNAQQYSQSLKNLGVDGLHTLQELDELKSQDDLVIKCVYGIVREVHEEDITKFKKVCLSDPTREEGIILISLRRKHTIHVQQIMKIYNLELHKPNYVFTHDTKVEYFPLFSYDYSEPEDDERNKTLKDLVFRAPEDREICLFLEEWYSKKVLSTSLSTLPGPGAFVNICVQVLAYKKRQLCINAIVWDTTKPKYSAAPWGESGFPDSNEFDKINLLDYPIACGKYYPLTIWQGKEQANHYDIFKCLSLKNGDSIAVLFNIQLSPDPRSSGFSLVMRSNRKCGKAIRICRPTSVLGRLFSEKLKEYSQDFCAKIGISRVYDVATLKHERQLPSPKPIESTRIELVDDDLMTQDESEIRGANEETLITDDEETQEKASSLKTVVEVQVVSNGKGIRDIRLREVNQDSEGQSESTADSMMNDELFQDEDESSEEDLARPIKRIRINDATEKLPSPIKSQPTAGPSGISAHQKEILIADQKSSYKLEALRLMGKEKLISYKRLVEKSNCFFEEDLKRGMLLDMIEMVLKNFADYSDSTDYNTDTGSEIA